MDSILPSHTWCPFEKIPSGPKAVSAAASCAFSLSTLEIASNSDAPGFAVLERKQPEIWRWAIIGDGCSILEEGFEPTREDAKLAASQALGLARAPVEVDLASAK